VNAAWLFRPFFGILIDRIESLEITLIFTSFLSGLLWLWLAVSVDQAILSVVLLSVVEFGPAISLTVADAMMVKYARRTGNWSVPQWCQVVRQLGKSAAGLAGSSQMRFGYRTMYYQQAVILCVFSNLLLAIELRRGCKRITPASPDPKNTTTTTEEDGGGAEDIKDGVHRSFAVYLFVSTLMPSSASAILLFLSGPMQFPTTIFGLLEFTELVSILGSCFTFARLSVSALTYMISVSVVMANVFLLGVIARQNIVDDSLILVTASIWISFITSVVHSRFTVETTKASPKGTEATFYAFYSFIPGLGQFLGALVTMALTAYYKIDHDNFEKLTLFHGACSIFQSLALFLSVSM
jgi:hypothetical protein